MLRVCCGLAALVVVAMYVYTLRVCSGFLLMHAHACFVCVRFVFCVSRSVLLWSVWLLLVLPTLSLFSLSFSFFLFLSLFLSFSLCLSSGNGNNSPKEKRTDSDPKAW